MTHRRAVKHGTAAAEGTGFAPAVPGSRCVL